VNKNRRQASGSLINFSGGIDRVSGVATLLVANAFRRSLSVQRQNVHLPLDRRRGRQKASLAVASLIHQFSRDREGLTLGPERLGERIGGAHFYVLPYAKCALEDGYILLDRWHIEDFRTRVNGRRQFQFRRRIDHEADGLVALRSRRIDVDTAREPHFRGQSDTASGNSGAVGLLDGELKMWRFNRTGHLFAKFREYPRNHVIPRVPSPVLGFEKLLANDALGIDEEISRSRHALVFSDGFGVQQIVSRDDFRIRVGE
jgi:hypothetical protein